MNTRNGWSWLIVPMLVLAFLVSGCGDKKPKRVCPTAPPPQEEPLETTPDPTILEGRTSAPMLPVYFAFDSSAITGDQPARLANNAEFIKQNPQLVIRIEGNTDERGTNEYNLALGERRAQSAKSYLTRKLGVDARQLTTVSFGEEKPLVFGSDEVSWAQNRRDDFVIVQ